MKTNKGEKYYTRPYVLWALLLGCIALGSIGGVAYDISQDRPLTSALLDRGSAALLCGMIGFWLSALVSWLSPLCLSATAIRSYTILGVYRTVEWAQVERIEAISFLGIRYARVHSKDAGSPIWIPEFLVKKDTFLVHLAEASNYARAVEDAFAGPQRPESSKILAVRQVPIGVEA